MSKRIKKLSEPVSSTGDVSAIYAVSGKSLGVKCYRGFASLAVLSQMSQADEYNQSNNPQGMQRELSSSHARRAYEYAASDAADKPRLWPEIILNIRKRDCVTIEKKAPTKGPKGFEMDFVKIKIHWNKIKELKPREVAISRVDGNHRLYYAGGDKKLPALHNVLSPFCIMDSVDIDNEKRIFATINSEQRKLNVNHLLTLEYHTIPETTKKKENLELWLAGKLHEDKLSPFYKRIHFAGRKEKGDTYLIRIKALIDGLNHFLKGFDTDELHNYSYIYEVTNAFFNAVAKTWAIEWNDKLNYKLMTNTGLQALGQFGAALLGHFSYANQPCNQDNFAVCMEKVAHGAPDFWKKKGGWVEPYSSRAGAVAIAKELDCTTNHLV
ncbi:MAG: DGQHR domain-containing protein [bacterium]|jgi:DGQHR domain-containing protein